MGLAFLLLTLYVISGDVYAGEMNCKFWKEQSCAQGTAMANLQLLVDANIKQPMVVSTKDVKDNQTYVYEISICQGVKSGETYQDVGVLQTIKKDGDDDKEVVIGRISNVSAIAWDRWMFLDYRGGEEYNKHCSGENRMARLMFTCAQIKEPKLRVVEEQKDKEKDCYYMFEIQHEVLCRDLNIPVSQSHKLSTGSVLLIIFFTFVAAYLAIGAAYQRFVGGAKGIDQIPHLSFWQDFGNLQADGCDFICRGMFRGRQSPEYRGIVGEDQQVIPEYESDVGRDDSLLPM